MTKEEFLNQEVFSYTGHLKILTRKELLYNPATMQLEVKERRFNEHIKLEELIDHDPWKIISVNNVSQYYHPVTKQAVTGFVIYHQQYGTVSIDYDECKKKEEPVNQL